MKIDTKLSKTGAAHETDLQLDWTGVTPAQERELAARSVAISWQRVERDSGKIRTGVVKVLVSDFLAGKGRPDKIVTPEKILASVEKMTPEAAAELLKKLTAASKAPKKS